MGKKFDITDHIDPTDPNAMSDALQEAVELIEILVNGWSPLPIFWTEMYSDKDAKRVKKIMERFGVWYKEDDDGETQ